jgi:hypothetical protein
MVSTEAATVILLMGIGRSAVRPLGWPADSLAWIPTYNFCPNEPLGVLLDGAKICYQKQMITFD